MVTHQAHTVTSCGGASQPDYNSVPVVSYKHYLVHICDTLCTEWPGYRPLTSARRPVTTCEERNVETKKGCPHCSLCRGSHGTVSVFRLRKQ